MSYTDLRDFSPEYVEARQEYVNGWYVDASVAIEKLGGGTVGREYSGEEWRYVVFYGGQTVLRGQDLVIGHAATHMEAADTALDFAKYYQEEGS